MSARAGNAVFVDVASRALSDVIDELAPLSDPVMLQGEPGSGKAFVARLLHARGRQARGPFVAVDCSTLDADAQRVALLGHEAGSVRGGFAAQPGWFERAHEGTLFLDEVQTLVPAVQALLLGVVQGGLVQRIGAPRACVVRVRLVCASSVALDGGRALLPGLRAKLCRHFVSVPGLAQRPDDIVPLAYHFLGRHAQRLHTVVPMLTPQAEWALRAHAWPGHLREMEALLQRALLRCVEGRVTPADLGLPEPQAFPDQAPRPEDVTHLLSELDGLFGRLADVAPGRLYELVDACLFTHAYRQAGGHQLQAAARLGVSRNVLRGRLITLGLIDARK